jgi:hypothetical protein
MAHRSPITPVTGIRRESLDASTFVRGEMTRAEAPSSPPSLVQTRDRAAAAALGLSAVVLAADVIVRPLLAPDLLPHPLVQWSVVGVLAATAAGVRLGWRTARRIARGLGFVAGAGSLLSLSQFASFASGAEWWVAGVWALEAALLGFMLQRLGWVGDEE